MSLAPSCGLSEPVHIINNHQIIGAPATRAVWERSHPLAPLHHLDSSVTSVPLGWPRPRPRFCTSTGLPHPLPTSSPLYRIVVSTPPTRCPSFRTFGWSGQRQSQQAARCQRGQHSLGGPPEQDSLDRPAGDCHVIGIPLSSYTRLPLFLSLSVPGLPSPHAPTLPRSSRAASKDYQNRTHCHHSQPAGATGAQLTDDPSPARSTDLTASTRTYVATQPVVHSAAREISLAQAA